MNIKRFFGTALIILGIFSLICTANLFISTGEGTINILAIFICGTLGLLFFISGANLVRLLDDVS